MHPLFFPPPLPPKKRLEKEISDKCEIQKNIEFIDSITGIDSFSETT